MDARVLQITAIQDQFCRVETMVDMILEMVNKITVMVKATVTDENSLRIHCRNKIDQRQILLFDL